MSRSRTILMTLLCASITVGLGLAGAQEAGQAGRQPVRQQPAVNPQPALMDMQQLLKLWEGQSAKLRTLELAIYRVDKDPKWGDEEHYWGHAAFKSPHLAFLDFSKIKMQQQPNPKHKGKKMLVPIKKDNRLDVVPFETIVCTGEEVWQYRYDVKQVYIFPLDKNQRKRALEEGPLPFLFNMRAADANQRYKMALKEQNAESYLVMIKPLLKEDQETFSTAWVYLDKKYLLPTRISLVGPDLASTKIFQLSEIKANQVVNPNFFKGVNPGKGFKIQRNPGGPAPANTVRGRQRQQEERAAKLAPAAGADQPR